MQNKKYYGDDIIDPRFDIFSYKKYLIDLEEKKLNKICMTEIVNSEMAISAFGEAKYFEGIKEGLSGVVFAIKSLGLEDKIFVYSNNHKNFIVATNDEITNEVFLEFMYGLYSQYEIVTAESNNLSGVSRFVVVFGGENMIGRAKSAIHMNKDTQSNFIVATDEHDRLLKDITSHQRVFDLLTYATKNNSVIPYYQGIYDNDLGKITKYEALMRIYDADGNVFTPYYFLDTAKNLKLYLTISKMMVNRVLSDFENKSSEVSINISFHDIQSVEFREWLLLRLKQFANSSKVTIEFVETENYNTDEVAEFLIEIKKIGCKIAIDDFGVGFATYTSVLSLKPDIIKIDGSIIKNLDKDDDTKLIIDAICYMSKLVGAKIVAEFVENENIQNIILENNIDFSQGYYFAKPVPIQELEII